MTNYDIEILPLFWVAMQWVLVIVGHLDLPSWGHMNQKKTSSKLVDFVALSANIFCPQKTRKIVDVDVEMYLLL